MERSVFLCVGFEEYPLGTVRELLQSSRQPALVLAIKGIVDDLVFSDDSVDHVVCSIEIR